MSRPFTGAILTRVQPARTLEGGKVGLEGGRLGWREGGMEARVGRKVGGKEGGRGSWIEGERREGWIALLDGGRDE